MARRRQLRLLMARVLRYRNVILGVVALAAVLAAGYFLYTATSRAQAKDVQPISFSHRVMVQKGIPCLYCHADARRSPAAGMPSVQKCMGCHLVIARSNPEVKKLAEYWQKGEPVPWVRINQLPRFVYFSHQAHLSAGLTWKSCSRLSRWTWDGASIVTSSSHRRRGSRTVSLAISRSAACLTRSIGEDS